MLKQKAFFFPKAISDSSAGMNHLCIVRVLATLGLSTLTLLSCEKVSLDDKEHLDQRVKTFSSYKFDEQDSMLVFNSTESYMQVRDSVLALNAYDLRDWISKYNPASPLASVFRALDSDEDAVVIDSISFSRQWSKVRSITDAFISKGRFIKIGDYLGFRGLNGDVWSTTLMGTDLERIYKSGRSYQSPTTFTSAYVKRNLTSRSRYLGSMECYDDSRPIGEYYYYSTQKTFYKVGNDDAVHDKKTKNKRYITGQFEVGTDVVPNTNNSSGSIFARVIGTPYASMYTSSFRRYGWPTKSFMSYKTNHSSSFNIEIITPDGDILRKWDSNSENDTHSAFMYTKLNVPTYGISDLFVQSALVSINYYGTFATHRGMGTGYELRYECR